MDPRLLALLTGLPQALTLLMAVLALRRGLESAGRTAPVPRIAGV
ncbi:MAG: hypothetical protein ABI895_25670 [Deltaproteobacteria bacterium]